MMNQPTSMKYCPNCGRSYLDLSLSFCLEDGSALLSAIDEQPTIVASRTQTVPQAKRRNGLWFLVLVAGVGFLVLAGSAAIGAFLYFLPKQADNTNTVSNIRSNEEIRRTSKDSATPTPERSDDVDFTESTNSLQKSLDDLKKVMSEMNTDISVERTDSVRIARVNSPRDGYLALRSSPSTETGERLTKIPHGTRIQVRDCESVTETAQGRKGRWCRVTYSGKTGYVADSWLTY
ncbi:MAG: SH3 domain-containing protein [Pyrinomonadaceae bacterium]